MPAKPSILVAVATYNEVENLPSLVLAIREALPTLDVLVIDDNSPDGTGKWCREFAEQNTWFVAEHRAGKLGLGSALASAMRFAVAGNYQILITMDADWSHPPSQLPAMVEASSRADVVIGSRYCPGGGIEGWPWRRRVASRLVNTLTRTALGIPVHDCSGNYRLYKTAVLSQLNWDDFTSTGYAFLEELLWYLHCGGARFIEVPILFTDRRLGSSKINLVEAAGALRTLLALTWRRIRFSRSSGVRK